MVTVDLSGHKHVLYFTYHFSNIDKLLRYVYVDYNNSVYYGELVRENGLTVPEKKILNKLKSDYKPKARALSRQSNTQCGFSESMMERCCCTRARKESDASYFASREIHLSSYYNKLYFTSNSNPRNCRQAMFHNWYRTPVLAVHKIDNSPMRCSVGRRRYFVKDGIISQKVALRANKRDVLNKTIEKRRNDLQTILTPIEGGLWDDMRLIKVCDLSKKVSIDIPRENKHLMMKIALSGEMKKIFSQFNKGYIDAKKLEVLCNRIKINDKLFKISPF